MSISERLVSHNMSQPHSGVSPPLARAVHIKILTRASLAIGFVFFHSRSIISREVRARSRTGGNIINTGAPWCKLLRTPARMGLGGESTGIGADGFGGGGGGKDYFVDTKLLFRMKQFVGDQRERSRAPVTEDSAMNYLLGKFKEYGRKPQGPLRKSVGKALRRCAEVNATPIRDRKKRSRPTDGGEDSREESGKQRKKSRSRDRDDRSDYETGGDLSEDEQAARKAEADMRGHVHNLLNQSLAKGYRNGANQGSPQGAATTAGRGSGDVEKLSKDAQQKRHKRVRPGVGTPSAGSSSDGVNAGGMVVERPSARYSDLGGISGVLQEVRELIEYPLVHPEVYAHLGIEPPRGILLHGPPGCGKTLLANAIAGELGVAFLRISAPEIVSGMSGESEQKVRELFRAAIENAPCIVFVDEVDAITPKRETSARGMEKRIVAQLLTCMDSLTMENTGGKAVMVIGATNRPNDLDSALRRAGRFDREICLGVPDLAARARILEVMCSKMTLGDDVDFQQISRKTPGFVGADLSSLTKEAAVVAINRIFSHLSSPSLIPAKATASSATPVEPSETVKDDNGSKEGSKVFNDGGVVEPKEQVVSEGCGGVEFAAEVATGPAGRGGILEGPLSPEQLAPLNVNMEDFLAAVKKVQPSAKREGFATVPGVTWKDVGALASVREELSLSILEPIACPERFERLGLSIPAGVLMYGPPGCGKTLLAKAIANESGANFISVKGPELLDKYVGESEKSVRQVFQRARASSPCIIFFDELDALCPRRGGGGSEGGGVSERVVNQLLTEMDGLEARRNVFVVAATNRPELIDSAMLRPGRLDRLLYVPLPSPEDRVSILRALSATVSLGPDVDLEKIGRSSKAEGFSGADLAALLREAGLDVLRRLKNHEAVEGDGAVITAGNFEKAFPRTQPSVSAVDRAFYLTMKNRLCNSSRSNAREQSTLKENGDEPHLPLPRRDGGRGNPCT